MNYGYCIKCGHELLKTIDSFQCVNIECELNNEKIDENNWSIENHKDNQNWAVRHIRIIESAIQSLTIDFQAEFNKINEFMGVLCDKQKELQSRIESLEDSKTNSPKS